MAYTPQTYKSMTISFEGLELTVTGIEYFPAVPATQIDPPEPPQLIWDEIFIGDINVTPLFRSISNVLCEWVEDELFRKLEA